MKKNRTILSAIKNREVLAFVYGGKIRQVEPQTYGLSTAGRPVLRAFQTGGDSRSGWIHIARLFDESKISGLKKTGATFAGPLPSHNPQDSAMTEIWAT